MLGLLGLAGGAASLVGCGVEPTLPGTPDECADVPVEGRCLSETELEICVVTSEGGDDVQRVTETCPTDTHCVELDDDTVCEPIGECISGQTECSDGVTLRECVDRAWTESTCDVSCEETGSGAVCASSEFATIDWSGRVEFEERVPNAAENPTDWGDLQVASARGFLVLALRGEEVIDSTVTGLDDGSFTLRIPETPFATDRVVVRAAHLEDDGELAVAVADPGHAAGTIDMDTTGPAAPSLWQWSFSLEATPSDGDVLTITEDMGSGAANVFDVTALAYRDVRANVDGRLSNVVAWIGRDVGWSCGACFNTNRIAVDGVGDFDTQIWYPLTSDGSEWSDTVIAHEAGHWVMAAVGRSPAEGGFHSVFIPAFPGLAWSDGWATGFGCSLVGSALYTDKQDGSFFWQNIDAFTASGGDLPAPSPTGEDVMESEVPGLLQRMSELEVSRIVWGLSGDGLAPLYAVLGSPRMTDTVDGGFERGYQRHAYEANMEQTDYVGVQVTPEPAPMVADFLDALNCSGFDRGVLAEVVGAADGYPYPVDAPLCR